MDKKEIALPVTALALDAAPFLFLALASLLSWSTFFLIIALFGFIVSPIVGIILGIIAACQGKKRIGRAGMTMAVAAIALPILAVGIFILLLSTNVVVISLM